MSHKSWKKEFYSVPAGRVRVKDSGKHVLLKWEGLSRKNLKKHGLRKRNHTYITDGTTNFHIHASSCAWCKIAQNRQRKHYGDTLCRHCPAVIVGMLPCTATQHNYNDENSPWGCFTHKSRIKEMLSWIRKAIKLIEEEGK